MDKHFFDDVTVWQAISNLPSPTEDGNIKTKKAENNYQEFLSSNSGRTFSCRRHCNKYIL